jgi:hypothetical protein
MFGRKKKPFKNIDDMRKVLLDLEQRGFIVRRTEPKEAWKLHPRWADTPEEDFFRAVEASYAGVP